MRTVTVTAHQTVKLDCVNLDPLVFENGGKKYRECLKGHGDIRGCEKPQKCGPMCADYEKKAVTGG
jgi:hypothetical protein